MGNSLGGGGGGGGDLGGNNINRDLTVFSNTDGNNASMMDPGDMSYPNNDIAKDEIIMKLRSQNVKLR